MFNGNASFPWGHLPMNIKIMCIDESGTPVDPLQLNEVDYLSRFQHKCVVNKVYSQMIAENRSGTIEIYQDKVVVKDNN
ncbi:MAG TPA: hypothetical protein VE035_16255 [Puia sp.]|nr:hypothetical protein [Puia sp.]